MSIAVRSIAGIVALALAAGACVSSTLDRHFDAERYLEVTRAFEADTTLHVQEEALYLAGLAYALPDSPAYDPGRAIQLFDRLRALYPHSRSATHAGHLQQLLTAGQEIEEERSRRDAEVSDLEQEITRLRATVADLEAKLATEQRRADGLHTVAEQLTRQLESRAQRIQELEEELAALKEIDLNRPPT